MTSPAPREADLRVAARAARPSLDVADDLRDVAIATWRGRMINEYSSARVFEGLAAQMRAAGYPDSIVEECRAFSDEERRHGVLCGAVVEALGGEARATMRDDGDFPEHRDVSRNEAVLRNVLSICCMAETVAVALVGAERLEMPDGELRELLTEIYADEVGHARFGWRLLAGAAPCLDRDARARLSDYLVVAFDHLERHELAHLSTSKRAPEGGAALGLCSGRDSRRLFYETVVEVIIPRLESLGLRAGAAWRQRRSASATVS